MKRILLISFYCLFAYCTYAQHIQKEIANSCGNSYNSTSAKLKFSIGEPVIGKLVHSTVSLSQGFLPGSMKNSIIIPPISSPAFTVYPNPAVTCIYLKGNLILMYRIQIFNSIGQMALQDKITGPEINVAFLKPGIYIGKLYNSNFQVIQIFKFIKN